MRILHISNNFTPYSGGIVSSLQTIIPAMQQRNHAIKLITLNFTKKRIQDQHWITRIPSFATFSYKKNHMAIPAFARRSIKNQIGEFQPDIIHVHHPFLLGAIAAKIAAKDNIPIIFTYHTMYEHYAHYVPLPHQLMKPLIKKKVISFCSKMSGIIAPSSYVKNYLVENGIECPIEVIPSPIAVDFFSLKSKTKRATDNCQLLVVSRFTKEKNLKFILEVFSQLPDQFNLTLVGYGSEYENLYAYAFEKLKLDKNRLTFVIKPPRNILLQLYADADIFLFSSQTDTQAIVLAEAMAAGLPVIALDGPGQRDIIQSGKNGFLVATAGQMQQAITSLWQKKESLNIMNQQAKITALKYSDSFIACLMEDVYQKNLHRD